MFWNKPVKPQFVPNFERDFALLFFLVKLEAENADWELDLMNKNSQNIGQPYMSELISKSVDAIIAKLSMGYLELLLKYLDKEGLVLTISEIISKNLITKGIKINKGNFGTEVTVDDVDE